MQSPEAQPQKLRLKRMIFAVWVVLAGILAIVCGRVDSALFDNESFWAGSSLALLALPLLPIAVFALLMASVVASSRWNTAKWAGRIYVVALLAIVVSGLMSGQENRSALVISGTGITIAVFFFHSLWLDRLHTASNLGDK